jgi:hypothetical protein
MGTNSIFRRGSWYCGRYYPQSWLTQGFGADRSRGCAQFLIQCGQRQRSALREFQIGPRRKVRVGSGRPDATYRSRHGHWYAGPWRCPDALDRRAPRGETRHRSACGGRRRSGYWQPPASTGRVRSRLRQSPDRTAPGSNPSFRRYISKRALPNYRGPDSRTAVVPEGFPLGPIEVAKLTLFRTGADTLKGSASLITVGVMPRRNEARDFPAVSGDRHFLAVLDQFEQIDRICSWPRKRRIHGCVSLFLL